MLILASKSPTRAAILDRFGIKYRQIGSDFDEDSINCDTPKSFVYLSCKGKMETCEEKLGLELPLLCADTVVSAGSKILRKAKDKDEAKELLLAQSGKSVSILTCVIYKSKELSFTDISKTTYLFSEFDKDDLEKYLDSNEWQGKAGACMVEGFCKKYIKEVIGLESCAMGLQIEKLLPFLEDKS